MDKVKVVDGKIQFNVHTMDAAVWAEAFCLQFPGHEKDVMLGWFANAIMAGWDNAIWGMQKAKEKTRIGRRVTVFKRDRDETRAIIKKEIGRGVFIQYGQDYIEYESGAGNFTTAIVEMDDGSVKNVPVELIQFIKLEV